MANFHVRSVAKPACTFGNLLGKQTRFWEQSIDTIQDPSFCIVKFIMQLF